MYIEYQYRPADYPDADYYSGLTIPNIKELIVADLVKIIVDHPDVDDLSELCMGVTYYGESSTSGWSYNPQPLDDLQNISLKSNSTLSQFKKYITISTSSDTTIDTAGFTTTIDPITGLVGYTDISSATLSLNIITYDFDDVGKTYRVIPESKLEKLDYYAQGGTIKISLSEKHIMMCSISADNTKYQPPLVIIDINTTDIPFESFPDFVFFDSKNLSSIGTASAYATIKNNTSIYNSLDYKPPAYTPSSKVTNSEKNLLASLEQYKIVSEYAEFAGLFDEEFYNTVKTGLENYLNQSPIVRWNYTLPIPDISSPEYNAYYLKILFNVVYAEYSKLRLNGNIDFTTTAKFSVLINNIHNIINSANYTRTTIPKTTNNYNIEIYDPIGTINFFKSDTEKYQYANHIYINYKVNTNYHFGGNISKDTQVYMLPKNSLGKTFDEITYDSKTYVVWSTYDNDFSIKYPRFLIYKG